MFVEVDRDIGSDLAEFAPDVVITSRPGLFMRVYPLVQGFGVPVVYLAHDLHFVRVGLGERLAGAGSRASQVMRTIEKLCFERADLSVLPTQEEVLRVAAEFPTARCVSMDYFAMPGRAAPVAPPPGATLAFVGSAAHGPNLDGITWFVTEVWPAVIARTPTARLTVCGVWPEASRSVATGVDYVGPVSDDALDALLAAARVGIAPLRFGAGMKRKTLHYLSLGLPTVGTGFAVEGLRSPDGTTPGVVTAETAEQWRDALELLDDDARWMELSRAGVEFVRDRFSSVRYLDGLAGVLASLR
ncbi:MAG: glycosyltransferase [Rhodoglobus sp.]